MVENSLGRLWSEGHPDFDKSDWKYYLDEAPQEPQVAQQLAELRKGYAALTPEDIKCIDPCMGSGHILAYLFDVLMQIYRSAGYTDRDAAASIVEHNLYGLDIDDRAAQMAYFVVMMKGCHYDSRFLRRHLNPHVYAIQESGELSQTAFGYCGPEEPTARTLWDTFRNAKEYGSILQPKVTLEELDKLEARLQEADRMAGYGSLGVQGLTYQLLDVMYPLIDQARMLVQKYDVVVTNPPYMGGSGMNARLSDYVKKVYPDSKSDLFACFMERADAFVKENRFTSLITMESWMFLSSFEKLRDKVNLNKTIVNMVHMPYLGKGGTSLGINFGTAAVVMKKGHIRNYAAQYEYTVYYECDEEGVPFVFPTKNERWKTATQENFSKIPGSPVAYWVGESFVRAFEVGKSISNYADAQASGHKTADNDKYIHFWFENCLESRNWVLLSKGGDFRRWYGNLENTLNWSVEAREFYKSNKTSNLMKAELCFKPGITWSDISSKGFSCRLLPHNATCETVGPAYIIENPENKYYFLGLLNSKFATYCLELLNSSMHFKFSDVSRIPIIVDHSQAGKVNALVQDSVLQSKTDWDSFETSWDFKHHPLV